MAGFFNGTIMNADNVDFTGGYPPTNQITTDGQLLIGSTAAPNIRAGTLTSTGGTVTITPGAGTINLEAAGSGGGLPITDFVVDPAGGGSYTTIQSAVTAANAAGGGSVWVRPGTYTENVTLYANVSVVGAVGGPNPAAGPGVRLIGYLAPPSAGDVEIRNIGFYNTTGSGVYSYAVGTGSVRVIDCEVTGAIDAFVDLYSWAGTIYLERVRIDSTSNPRIVSAGTSSTVYMDDVVNDNYSSTLLRSWINGALFMNGCRNMAIEQSTGSSVVYVVNNSTFDFIKVTNGDTSFYNCSIKGRQFLQTGGSAAFFNCSGYTTGSLAPFQFTGASAAMTASMYGCTATNTTTSAVSAYDYSNGCVLNMYNCVIDAAGSGPAIAATAATVNLCNVSFPNASALSSLSYPTINYVGGIGGGGIGWSEETGTTAQMKRNFGYVANNGTGITLTLPLTSVVGDVIEVVGKGAGNWVVAQNAGQTIYNVAAASTTGLGGTLAPTEASATVRMVCITRNLDWRIVSSTGTIVLT
jgi:hypothetical protein